MLDTTMDNYRNEIFLIKELLKKNPRGLNIREIADCLNYNRNSIAKYLDILTSREEADVRIHGKAKVYYLSQNVPVSDLMEFSSKFIVVLNRDLRIVQVNDAFSRFSKIPKNQLLQLKIDEIPADIFLDPAISDAINCALSGNEITKEFSVKINPGTLVISVTFTPTRFQDQSGGVILIFEDITRKKEIERALKKSEEKYRNLIENLSDVVITVDCDGIITYVSPRIASFGYKPEDIVSKKYDILIFPDDRKEVYQHFKKLKKTKKMTIPPTFRILDRSNTPVWVESNGKIQYDESGVITGVTGVLRDVTGRKRAEEEILALTKKNEEVLRIARMGYWEFDFKTKTFLFNDRFYSLLGLTAEEAGGYRMPVETFAQTYVPAERGGDVMDILPWIRATADPRSQMQFESCVLRADGERRDVNVWIQVEKDPGGEILSVYGVTQDITDRRRAEEALRASEARYWSLVGLLPDAVVVHGDGKIVYVNPACTRILGGAAAEEIVGKPVLSFVHPDDHGIVLEHIRRMTDTKCTIPLTEERFLTLNGEVIIVEVTSTMSIYQGKPSFMVVFRDITSRRETEEFLRLSEEQARLLLQKASDAVYVLDVSRGKPGKILEVNDAGCRMLGYTREELIGMSVTDIDKTGFKILVPDLIRETLENGHELFETMHCVKGGCPVPVEVGVRLFPLQGKPAILTIVREKS